MSTISFEIVSTNYEIYKSEYTMRENIITTPKLEKCYMISSAPEASLEMDSSSMECVINVDTEKLVRFEVPKIKSDYPYILHCLSWSERKRYKTLLFETKKGLNDFIKWIAVWFCSHENTERYGKQIGEFLIDYEDNGMSNFILITDSKHNVISVQDIRFCLCLP